MFGKFFEWTWARACPPMRWYLVSYEALIATWALLLGAHVQWGTLTDDAGRGEAVSAFGAWTIVLGIAVAARPYVRGGLLPVAAAQARPPAFMGYAGRGTIGQARTSHAERTAAALPDVYAERVWAVLVIVVGTLVNGYGAPIGRLLSGLE